MPWTRTASCASRWRNSQASPPTSQPGELETALRIVQTLEPSGIAARDLGECLSLQLQALERGTAGTRARARYRAEQAGAHGRPRQHAAAGGPGLLGRGSARWPGADPQPRPAARLQGRHVRAARDRSGRDRPQGKEALGREHQCRDLSAHPREPTVRRLLPAGARRRDDTARAASAGSALAGAQSRAALPDDSARRRGGCRAAEATSSSTATWPCVR